MSRSEEINEKIVATLRRGQKEELRVTVTDRNGRRTIKLRSWFMAKDGQFRPGKDGMHIRADIIDDVLEALVRAKAEPYKT